MSVIRRKRIIVGTLCGAFLLLLIGGVDAQFTESAWTSPEDLPDPRQLAEELCFALELRTAWFYPGGQDPSDPMRPEEWPKVEAALRTAANEYKWLDAANEVEKLEGLLPNPMPDSYPWTWETLYEYRAGRAELYMLAGDLDASRELCEQTLDEIQAHNGSSETFHMGSYAEAAVHRILSNISALEGDYVEALELFEQSLNDDWSGCGNCEEGEDIWSTPTLQALEAAIEPEARAIATLKDIVKGRSRVVDAKLNATSAQEQRAHSAAEATFILAQFELRDGDKEAAREHLKQVVNAYYSSSKLIASALLKRLDTSR